MPNHKIQTSSYNLRSQSQAPSSSTSPTLKETSSVQKKASEALVHLRSQTPKGLPVKASIVRTINLEDFRESPFKLAKTIEIHGNSIEKFTGVNCLPQDKLIEILAKFPNLKTFEFTCKESPNKTEGHRNAILETLAKHCPKLEDFSFQNAEESITDHSITCFLRSCKDLKKFTLTNSSTVNFQYQQQFHLTHICLEGCTMICSGSLRYLMSSFPNLEILELPMRVKCRISAVIDSVEASCSLKKLSLPYPSTGIFNHPPTEDLIEKYIKTAIATYPNLTHLHLRKFHQLPKETLEWIGKTCTKLTHLTLEDFEDLNNDSLNALADHYKNLTSINFKGSKVGAIANTSYVTLAKNCSSLEEVDFSLCNDVTDPIILAFVENSPSIQGINLKDNWKLTEASFEAINQKFSQ